MRRCPRCREYTLGEDCPKCGTKTVSPIPPKFSPSDKYARYRIPRPSRDEDHTNRSEDQTA